MFINHKTSLRINALVLLAVVAVLGITVPSSAAEELAFYVSPEGDDSSSGDSADQPFATIQKARDAIRAIKTRGPLTRPVAVYLRGGTYELSETLVFTPDDSGTKACPITYLAYPGETPILSGGVQIAGPWKTHQGQILVCSLGDAIANNAQFKQLFASGKRMVRARTPNDDFYRIKVGKGDSAFQFEQGDLRPWNHLDQVEVVLFHSWNTSRLLIAELDEAERLVTFSAPIGRKLARGRRRNRYYVENLLEALDRPGEWYCDHRAGNLYFWPTDDIETLEIRVPVLNQLVRFEGDLDQGGEHVEYLNLRGLTFADTAWTLPEAGIPAITDVGEIPGPSAIALEGASHCSIENNRVRNVGTYAIEVTGQANRIVSNEIDDAGAGGIISRNLGTQPNTIANNHIHHSGSVFPSAVGINIDDGGGLVAHNLIHDLPQSGIYARHQARDYEDRNARQRKNQSHKLTIEYNEIYNVMQNMNDGGGVFVGDANVVIRNNVIHDIHAYGRGAPGWGIYLGCDTSGALVENNYISHVGGGLHLWYSNNNVVIENNMFLECDLSLIKASNPKDQQHGNIRMLRNVFYYTRTDADLFAIRGERSVPAESDYNLLWNPSGCIWLKPCIWGWRGSAYFEEWKKRGLDAHSVVADPLFVDAPNGDFTLKPNSPAFQVGFKPIDLSQVGPTDQLPGEILTDTPP